LIDAHGLLLPCGEPHQLAQKVIGSIVNIF